MLKKNLDMTASFYKLYTPLSSKVHIFCEGRRILRNLTLNFDVSNKRDSQKLLSFFIK